MNFFKKLFTSKKEGNKPSKPTNTNTTKEANSEQKIHSIASHEYFESRYTEDAISESMLEGALKLIEGYFEANKFKPAVKSPINHPKNLDQTIDEGFGFLLYCEAVQLDKSFAIGVLTIAFNDFLMKNHGFKLYKDAEPEYPMRDMTLKYEKEGTRMSLYPVEYTVKVVNYEASYEELYEKIKVQIKNLPTANEVIEKYTKGLQND